MKLSKTLMMSAAAIMLTAGAASAEGYTSGAADTHTDATLGHQASPSADAGTEFRDDPAARERAMQNAGASSAATANNNVVADAKTVQGVQDSLRNAGHSVSVDGVWGPQTADALRSFQQQNGLTPTGRIDTQTLAALHVDR